MATSTAVMAVGVLCARPRTSTSSRRQRSSSVVCAFKHTQSSACQAASDLTRRGVLLASMLGTAALKIGPAQAGLVQDLMKQNMRGNLDPIEAIVQLMDARGVLYEIRDLAATPKDSPERKASYSLLPGYASRLRKLANAAPTVAGLAAGTDKEAQVSVAYGGEGQDTSLTDPIFITAGQVLNYSGRGLSEAAVADPACAAAAISAIEDLLGKVPQNALATAQARREAARAARRT